MPDYPWFFDGSPDKPSAKGLAIITYVQWLASWQECYPYNEDYLQSIERPRTKGEFAIATKKTTLPPRPMTSELMQLVVRLKLHDDKLVRLSFEILKEITCQLQLLPMPIPLRDEKGLRGLS